MIDTQHTVSSVFQFVNVPTGVWIDEKGRVIRPAEPSWNQNRIYDYGDKRIVTEGETYVAALRDWVRNGETSAYVLSDDEFARRVKSRSSAEMEAEASFKLAVWFQRSGQSQLASKYFDHAQQLNPEDWNYYRQQWSFTPQEAGQKWLDKFRKEDQPYYPKLEIVPQNPKPKP